LVGGNSYIPLGIDIKQLVAIGEPRHQILLKTTRDKAVGDIVKEKYIMHIDRNFAVHHAILIYPTANGGGPVLVKTDRTALSRDPDHVMDLTGHPTEKALGGWIIPVRRSAA